MQTREKFDWEMLAPEFKEVCPRDDTESIRACGECGYTEICTPKFCPNCRKTGHLKNMRTINQLEWSKRLWAFYDRQWGVVHVEQAIENILKYDSSLLK